VYYLIHHLGLIWTLRICVFDVTIWIWWDTKISPGS